MAANHLQACMTLLGICSGITTVHSMVKPQGFDTISSYQHICAHMDGTGVVHNMHLPSLCISLTGAPLPSNGSMICN